MNIDQEGCYESLKISLTEFKEPLEYEAWVR